MTRGVGCSCCVELSMLWSRCVGVCACVCVYYRQRAALQDACQTDDHTALWRTAQQSRCSINNNIVVIIIISSSSSSSNVTTACRWSKYYRTTNFIWRAVNTRRRVKLTGVVTWPWWRHNDDATRTARATYWVTLSTGTEVALTAAGRWTSPAMPSQTSSQVSRISHSISCCSENFMPELTLNLTMLARRTVFWLIHPCDRQTEGQSVGQTELRSLRRAESSSCFRA